MKKILLACLTTLLILLPSCSALQALRLKDCTYQYSHISGLKFMGLTVHDMATISGSAKIAKALLGKTDNVPLGFTVHLDANNPNKKTAAIEKLFYTVDIDSIRIADGNTETSIIMPPGTTTEVPIYVSVNLKELLSSNAKPTVKKIIKQFIGLEDQPTLVTVSLKPVIRVGDHLLSLKTIPVHFQYGGQKKDGKKH